MTQTPPSKFPDSATSSQNTDSSAPSSVCLTYNMNILQHIPTSTFGDVLVTLNPITPPDPASIQGRYIYHHPLYNATVIRSQKLLAGIQNRRGISYAGAWTKYGFHEDGFSSGIKVAIEHLGAELPWEFVDSTFSRGRRPELGWKDYVVRLMVLLMQACIWIGEGVVAVLIGDKGSRVMNGVTKKVQ
jgi:predicted NAD/FAD-binding protein